MSSSDLRRLRSLSGAEGARLAEAAVLLGLVRLGVRLLPLRRVTAVLGLTETAVDPPTQSSLSTSDAATADAVGRAVRSVAGRTPWKSTCLVQSLAGHVMLRRRHIASTVYLGVAKGPAGELAAHSWLDAGGDLLTGEDGHGSFSPIAVLVRSRHF